MHFQNISTPLFGRFFDVLLRRLVDTYNFRYTNQRGKGVKDLSIPCEKQEKRPKLAYYEVFYELHSSWNIGIIGYLPYPSYHQLGLYRPLAQVMKKIPKINANVVLCKCPSSKGVFGIRIEEREHDWVRTWAFKINESKAKREGFDKVKITSSMIAASEYPGCPYCGTMNIALCSCGKLFCWSGESGQLTCPWCGQRDDYHTVDTIEFEGKGL
ncbi:hypothetical protein LQZ21_01465 [Treponema sp. TIM-1]|uniref:TerY-C metal binding domain-containing protein n=1 Tax=Treponema sp. TIM-1 TaxID=2898417 RepID=UPI00397F9BCC